MTADSERLAQIEARVARAERLAITSKALPTADLRWLLDRLREAAKGRPGREHRCPTCEHCYVLEAAEERAETAEAALARVKALADELQRRCDMAVSSAEARKGLSDENALLTYGSTLAGIVSELRAALGAES